MISPFSNLSVRQLLRVGKGMLIRSFGVGA
jgi:hypothetical protein